MPPEIAPWLTVVAVLVFSAWMVYEHRRISGGKVELRDVAHIAELDRDAARYTASLLGSHTHAIQAHVHAYAPLDHEHPHEHEHVQHTHTLAKVSEHEENGKKVVVKKCDLCDTVFRDRQE